MATRTMVGRIVASAGLALVVGAGTVAQAQSISPSSVTRTIAVGQTVTINKSITLGPAGATNVDVFFLADNTGSMGGIINAAMNGASAILGALPTTYQFGVGRYLGDPTEPGETPATAYTQLVPLTTNQANVVAGIDSWFASGGGDTPEANFYALQQVATTAGWRMAAQRLIVWFGDAPSHTVTTTQAQAIAALQAANAKVIAFNSGSLDTGIDAGGQATGIVAGAGGSLTNDMTSLSNASFIDAVTSQIGAATSTIDLVFGSSFGGSGLTLSFLCTDPLGCNHVNAGETRTFDLSITGVAPGTYSFDVFAQGVPAVESDRITVTSAVPEPATVVLTLTGLVAVAGGAYRRRAG